MTGKYPNRAWREKGLELIGKQKGGYDESRQQIAYPDNTESPLRYWSKCTEVRSVRGCSGCTRDGNCPLQEMGTKTNRICRWRVEKPEAQC